MALDGTTMGQSVAAAVVASAPSDGAPVTTAQLEAVWIAACTEIVNHIKANGVTTTPVTSGSSAGTYPGTIS
jgi:hypothetical protein